MCSRAVSPACSAQASPVGSDDDEPDLAVDLAGSSEAGTKGAKAGAGKAGGKWEHFGELHERMAAARILSDA